jgi:hypothetical protein
MGFWGFFTYKMGVFEVKMGVFDIKMGIFDIKMGGFGIKSGVFDIKMGVFYYKKWVETAAGGHYGQVSWNFGVYDAFFLFLPTKSLFFTNQIPVFY